MKLITACMLQCAVLSTFAQQNIVRTYEAKVPIQSDIREEYAVDKVRITTQYFDGLGRPIQTNAYKASPTLNDIISPVIYDGFGRTNTQYLPFTSHEGGVLVDDPLSAQAAFYAPGQDVYHALSATPYAVTITEESPLGRILEQGSPGTEWQPGQHAVRFRYGTNTASEVLRFTWDHSIDEVVYSGTYYPAGYFSVKITEDENDQDSREYIDYIGRTLLKRMNASNPHDTYYIYDDFGRLRIVLQPQGVEELTSGTSLATVRQQHAFEYTYDVEGKMTGKKVPGADWVYLLYDGRDRLVLTQDGNQRLNNQWLFTQYDGLNRPVMTGIYTTTQSRADLENLLKAEKGFEQKDPSQPHGYTHHTFPQSGITTYHTITYYDDYALVPDTLDAQFPTDLEGIIDLNHARGQVTASKTKVLGTADFLWTVNYYDNRSRLLKTISQQLAGAKDAFYSEYDFEGKVTQTRRAHSGPEAVTINERFEYDHQGRMLRQYHQLDSEPEVLLAEQTYNELGELKEKNLGNRIQSIDYAYNIRGWLTSINKEVEVNDRFSMEMGYTDLLGLGSSLPVNYNGNISAIKWKTDDQDWQAYRYEYDALNRIKRGEYHNLQDPGALDAYGMSVSGYDKNGNILNLNRNYYSTAVDDLTYSYTGNQLDAVTDAIADPVIDSGYTGENDDLFVDGNTGTNDYLYDANGNLIRDLNKDITDIEYNHLNLPELVTFGDGKTVDYTYDAAGIKLQKAYFNGSATETTDYLTGIHYQNSQLDFIQHAEGRAVYDSTGFAYEYHLTDHLGNVRVSIDSSGNVVQRDDYYPFGLRYNSWGISPKNRYLYNGKETQSETGWYDYGARFHDAMIARFTTQDPYSYVYQSYSPYGYALNNPIRFEDTEGEGPGDRVKFAKSLLGTPYLMGGNNGDAHWKTARTPAALRLMDCSELVFRVLAADGIFDETYYANTSGLKRIFNQDGDNGLFIKSQSPEIGDIFLWRSQEATYGHTGIVTGIVEDDDGNIVSVEITHASGDKDKVVAEEKSLSWFTSKDGWEGFHRPKIESEDGKENTIGGRTYDLEGMTASQKLNLLNDVLLDLQRNMERSKARREDRKKRREDRKKRKEENNKG